MKRESSDASSAGLLPDAFSSMAADGSPPRSRSGSRRRRAQKVVELLRAAKRGGDGGEPLHDQARSMVERQLAAVLGGRQLDRKLVRPEHEEAEHKISCARRVPARFSPPVRFVAHFWRLFLKACFTKV